MANIEFIYFNKFHFLKLFCLFSVGQAWVVCNGRCLWFYSIDIFLTSVSMLNIEKKNYSKYLINVEISFLLFKKKLIRKHEKKQH